MHALRAAQAVSYTHLDVYKRQTPADAINPLDLQLGLRSLYFVLAAIIKRFHYLKYALSVVLIFIGSKSFIAYLMGWDKSVSYTHLDVYKRQLGRHPWQRRPFR